MTLLWFVIIGAIAGWLAGQFMRGNGFGLLGDIVVGVIGSFLGSWLFGATGIAGGGLLGSLIVAFIGAVVLLFVVRLFTGRRAGRKVWS